MSRRANPFLSARGACFHALVSGLSLLTLVSPVRSEDAIVLVTPSTAVDELAADLVDLPESEVPEVVESEISELVPKYLAADLEELQQEGIDRVRLTHVYQVEMERTDKQVGAGADSSGSTSLAEKAGIPWLLGLAVENGAITQTKDKTGLTLSTSPYALLMLGQEDTPDQYERYEWARRLGVSAVFPLENDGSAEDRNFDPKGFSAIGAKLVVWGDRNPRSPEFVEAWNRDVRPLVVKRLVADTKISTAVMSVSTVRLAVVSIAAAISSRVLAERRTRVTPAALEAKLKIVIDEEVRRGLAGIDVNEFEEARRDAIADAAREVDAAYRGIGEEQKVLRKMLDDLAASPEVSIAYTFHQKVDDTDYSDLKLLANFDVGPVDVLANAAVSLNHNDGTLLNSMGQPLHREGLRDASATLSVEFPIRLETYPLRVNDGGRRDILFSLSGRFEYLEDVSSEMGVGQAKLVIPLATGVDLPISMTYASRSEYVNEDEIRGNFGITIDTDKLYSLARLYSAGLRQ